MAGELKHRSVGSQLTQAEYEAVDGHLVDSGAQGDLLYVDAAGKVVRLPAGTAGLPLKTGGAGANPSFGQLANAALGADVARINLLANGGFEVWQRGAGPFSAHGAYTADRWQIVMAGTDVVQVDREAAVRKPDSLYSAKIAFTLGTGAGASRLKQRLVMSDGYHQLLGKKVSLRLSVRADAAGAVRAVVTTDGTGGTSTYSGYHAGDSQWADLDVVAVAVPSDATYVEVGVALAATATAYVDDAMLVQGSVAAEYMALHPAEEWERCQRYYEAHLGQSVPHVGWIYGTAANAPQVHYLFATRKCVVPSVTKLGTWTLGGVASAQPSVAVCTVVGYTLALPCNGTGMADANPGVAGGIVAEANP